MEVSNTMPAIRAPKGFKARGKATFKRITSIYELSPSEVVLLTELCRTVDRIEAINEQVDRDGLTVSGGRGQMPRAHPLLVALTQAQRTVSDLLGELDLPMPPPAQKSEPAEPPAAVVLAFS
jgi:hypothetical protein